MTPATHIKDRNFWLEFIDSYRMLPCLWNENHVHFASRKIRDQAFAQLLQKVQIIWPEAQIDFVKQRINNFRRTFINEYNKVQQLKKEGGTTSYVPSLYYYNHLRFLKEDDTDQSSEQSEDSDDDGHSELSASKDGFQSQTVPITNLTGDVEFMATCKSISIPSPSSPSNNEDSRPNKRQRLLQESENNVEVEYHLEEVSGNVQILEFDKTNAENSDTEFSEIEVLPDVEIHHSEHSEVLLQPATNMEDEFDVIAKRVAMHFRKMNSQQCLYAERLIFDVCIWGRLNRLTEDTNLTSPPRQANDINIGAK